MFLQTLFEQVNTLDVMVSCTEKMPGYAAHLEEVVTCVRALAKESNRNGTRPLVHRLAYETLKAEEDPGQLES